MDTQTLITTASICAVVFMLLVSVLPGMLRGVIANKAQNQFMAGDFDAVLKTLSGPMASFCLPKYNQEYMRLNAYEAKQDVEGVQRTLDVMLGLRATAQQRRILLSRALNFYETQGDEERAREYLDRIAKSYGLVPNDEDDEAPTEDAGEGAGDGWHEEDGACRR